MAGDWIDREAPAASPPARARCCWNPSRHSGATVKARRSPEGDQRNLVSEDEGCLSLPGGYQPLARPDKAICTGVDPWGNPVTIEGTGKLARCLQHETDHLNGTVFGDRLSGRLRRKLYAQHEELAHLYPDDWPLTPKRTSADG